MPGGAVVLGWRDAAPVTGSGEHDPGGTPPERASVLGSPSNRDSLRGTTATRPHAISSSITRSPDGSRLIRRWTSREVASERGATTSATLAVNRRCRTAAGAPAAPGAACLLALSECVEQGRIPYSTQRTRCPPQPALEPRDHDLLHRGEVNRLEPSCAACSGKSTRSKRLGNRGMPRYGQ